jgi:hypothetical protein
MFTVDDAYWRMLTCGNIHIRAWKINVSKMNINVCWNEDWGVRMCGPCCQSSSLGVIKVPTIARRRGCGVHQVTRSSWPRRSVFGCGLSADNGNGRRLCLVVVQSRLKRPVVVAAMSRVKFVYWGVVSVVTRWWCQLSPGARPHLPRVCHQLHPMSTTQEQKPRGAHYCTV